MILKQKLNSGRYPLFTYYPHGRDIEKLLIDAVLFHLLIDTFTNIKL